MSVVNVAGVGSGNDGSMNVEPFEGPTVMLDGGYAFLKLDIPTSPTGLGSEQDDAARADAYFMMRVVVTPRGLIWRDRDGATDYYLELKRQEIDEVTLTPKSVTVYDSVRIGDEVTVVSASRVVQAHIDRIVGHASSVDARCVKGRVREAIICL